MKNPARVRGGEEEGGVEGQPGAGDSGKGDRGRRQKMGRWGIRGLKARVRRECSINGGDTLYSRGIHVGGVRGGSHSVTRRDTAWEAASGVRAAKSSKFGEEKL